MLIPESEQAQVIEALRIVADYESSPSTRIAYRSLDRIRQATALCKTCEHERYLHKSDEACEVYIWRSIFDSTACSCSKFVPKAESNVT